MINDIRNENFNVNRAYELAKNAHKGQKDKAGLDYIFHPLAVSKMVETEEEKVVALLHDVIEDTDVKIETIEKEFGSKICEAVGVLTKTKDCKYMEYLTKIKNNPIARKVKIADMIHNSDLTRLKNPTQEDLARVEKYKRGIEFLKSN